MRRIAVGISGAALGVVLLGCQGIEPLPFCSDEVACPEGMACDRATFTCVPLSWEAGLTPPPPDQRVPEPDLPPPSPDLGPDLPAPDLPGQSLGTSCYTDVDCRSGHCADGVCCAQAKCATCERCDRGPTPGTCGPVPDGLPCGPPVCTAGIRTTLSCIIGVCSSKHVDCAPFLCNDTATDCDKTCKIQADCHKDAYCDTKTLTCVAKQKNGTKCSGDEQCSSGVCHATDKLCCDTSCTGSCESCKVSGKVGTCTPLPLGTPCGPATCKSGVVERMVCGPSAPSTCVKQTATCAPYRCDPSRPACATSCAKDAECTTGLCDFFSVLTAKGTCAQQTQICHVNAAAPACPGTGTQAAPYCKIQPCLDAKKTYTLVKNGTYNENLSFKGNGVVIATGTVAPVTVTGAIKLPFPLKVTLSTTPTSAGITVPAGLRAGLYGVLVTAASGTASTGSPLMTVTGANTRVEVRSSYFWLPYKEEAISAVAPSGSSLTVTLADVAVASTSAEGIVGQNAVVVGNSLGVGDTKTIGIFLTGGKLELRDSLVALNKGIGVNVRNGEVDIERVRIGGNGGSGIILENSTRGRVVNVLVNQNSNHGMEIHYGGVVPTLINNTLVDNAGLELFCNATGIAPFVMLYNSILWDAVKSGVPVYMGSCRFEYSDVQGNGSTGTNIDKDPKFVGLPVNKHHPYILSSTSPCVDQGTGTVPGATLPALDLLGKPRMVQIKSSAPGTVDMGPYEVQKP